MRFRNAKIVKKILLVTKNSNAYTSHVLGASVKFIRCKIVEVLATTVTTAAYLKL